MHYNSLIISNKKIKSDLDIINFNELDDKIIEKYDFFIIFFDNNHFGEFHLSNKLVKLGETKKVYFYNQNNGPAFFFITKVHMKNFHNLFKDEWFTFLKMSVPDITPESFITRNETFCGDFGITYKPTIDNLKESIDLFLPNFDNLQISSYTFMKLNNYLGIISKADDEVIDYAFEIIENYINFSLLNKVDHFSVVFDVDMTKKFFDKFGFYVDLPII